jgi:hypothetical protein
MPWNYCLLGINRPALNNESSSGYPQIDVGYYRKNIGVYLKVKL